MTTALIIGNFDGVHKGHQELIQQAHLVADEVVALTFWPHTKAVVSPSTAPLLITDLQRRVDWLRWYGVNRVEVLEFDTNVCNWSPEEFVTRAVVPLRADSVLVGKNFRFGSKASGDVAQLAEFGAQAEKIFEVNIANLVEVDGQPVSSSRIRRFLADGNVTEAAQLLGREYEFFGTVVHGKKRGREFGFPTANLPVPNWQAAPADGVYSGWVDWANNPTDSPMPAVISVGTNPTFDDVPEVLVEANVLDRNDLDLYDQVIDVAFTQRLRGQVAFHSTDELILQMKQDADQARQLCRENKAFIRTID